MPIHPNDRFKTAREFILARDWAPGLEEETIDALCSITVKRHGVWSRRRTPPEEPAARCAWEAARVASHAARWGYLPSHKSESMIYFFMMNPDQVERFDRLYDSFLKLAKRGRAV